MPRDLFQRRFDLALVVWCLNHVRRLEVAPAIVAHHYTEAGLAEPATHCCLKAAEMALTRSADMWGRSNARLPAAPAPARLASARRTAQSARRSSVPSTRSGPSQWADTDSRLGSTATMRDMARSPRCRDPKA